MATATASKRGVLIIDPQPHMASLIASMARSLGLHDIREISDAATALSAMQRHLFEVILIDDALRDMDSITLVQRVRTGADNPNRLTPIIMMAAAPDTTRITAARDAGINEFLRKPFAANHLKSRLDSIAAKPRAFIEAKGYTGPDRRRRIKDIAEGAERRKPSSQADGPENDNTQA